MMYVKIVEITAQTKFQLNIFCDYLKITNFPKNLYKPKFQQKV